MTQATKDVLLHGLSIFVVTFASVLTATNITGASVATWEAALLAAANAAILATGHFFSGLVPNSTVVAQSKADKEIKKALK